MARVGTADESNERMIVNRHRSAKSSRVEAGGYPQRRSEHTPKALLKRNECLSEKMTCHAPVTFTWLTSLLLEPRD